MGSLVVTYGVFMLVRLGFYGADGLVTVISSSACIRCFVADRRMAEENDLPDCLTGFNADRVMLSHVLEFKC